MVLRALASLFLVCCLACSTVPVSEDNDNRTVYYYDLISVNYDKRPLIIEAFKEIDSNVPCIVFKDIKDKTKSVDEKHIIFYMSVAAPPNTIVGAPANYVGLELDELKVRVVLLPENEIDAAGGLRKLSDDYLFKIMLHETSHALGMPADHPFSNSQNADTVFAPSISNSSAKSLSKMDIDYLNRLVCNYP